MEWPQTEACRTIKCGWIYVTGRFGPTAACLTSTSTRFTHDHIKNKSYSWVTTTNCTFTHHVRVLLHKIHTVLSKISTPQVQKKQPLYTRTQRFGSVSRQTSTTSHPETTTCIQSRPRGKCLKLLDYSCTRGSKQLWIRHTKAQRETVWHGCTETMGCHVYASSFHPFIGGASPHSATNQAWLQFPLTSGYLILFYCLNTNDYSHLYCIWSLLRLFLKILLHYCTGDKGLSTTEATAKLRI